jgi:hypothetical protein
MLCIVSALWSWCLSAAAAGGTQLGFNETSFMVQVTDEQVASANSYILTIGFNQSITGSDYILIIAGNQSVLFNIDQDTGVIRTSQPNITAGQYSFSVVFAQGNVFLIATVFVNVISLNGACQLQAFGACSQICQSSNTSSTGYVCSCVDGFTLQNDLMTCTANDPQPILLFSRGNTFYQFQLSLRQSQTFYTPPIPHTIESFDYYYTKEVSIHLR